MLICIFGESCVGKSTLAERLKDALGAELFTGNDYKRLAKNEADARAAFVAKLKGALEGGSVVYVASEREQLALVPDGALRVIRDSGAQCNNGALRKANARRIAAAR